MPLTFNDYQDSQYYIHEPYLDAVTYNVLGIAGECGELVEEFKKAIRETGPESLTVQHQDKMIDEMGDILWYISKLAYEMDMTLEAIAQRNIDKLKYRQIHGKEV